MWFGSLTESASEGREALSDARARGVLPLQDLPGCGKRGLGWQAGPGSCAPARGLRAVIRATCELGDLALPVCQPSLGLAPRGCFQVTAPAKRVHVLRTLHGLVLPPKKASTFHG